MALAPFATPAGNPDPSAMMQQMGLIRCIYLNAPTTFQAILDEVGTGRIINFSPQADSWPPAFAIAREGNNIYVGVAGTVNLYQWWGNLTGGFVGPYFGRPLLAHRFFRQVFDNLLPRIMAALPVDWPTCRFFFTGHSLGAAAALFLALEWAQLYGLTFPAFLGFATPKIMTTGYVGPLPSPCLTVATIFDAVPMTPFRPTFIAAPLTDGLFSWGIPAHWTHYENCFTVELNGNVEAVTVSYFDGPASAAELAQTATVHPSAYYTRSCLGAWRQAPTNSGNEAAYNTIALAANSESAPPFNGPMETPGTIDPVQQNLEVFLGNATFPLTESNRTAISSVVGRLSGLTSSSPISSGVGNMAVTQVKMVFQFTDNLGSFTDVWVVAGSGVSAVTIAQLKRYVELRLLLSGQQTAFQRVRVSPIGAFRQARVFFPTDLTLDSVFGQFLFGRQRASRDANEVSNSVKDSDASFTAIMLNKISTTTIGRWFFRGGPDLMSVEGGIPNRGVANWTTALNNLASYIASLNWGWMATVANAGQNAAVAINSFALQPDGTQVINLGGNLFGGGNITFGSTRFQVRIRRVTSPVWLNGQLTVTAFSANQAQTIRQTPVQNFVPGQAQMYIPQRTLFLTLTDPKAVGAPVPSGLQIESIRARKSGRPFGLFRGRASARVKV